LKNAAKDKRESKKRKTPDVQDKTKSTPLSKDQGNISALVTKLLSSTPKNRKLNFDKDEDKKEEVALSSDSESDEELDDIEDLPADILIRNMPEIKQVVLLVLKNPLLSFKLGSRSGISEVIEISVQRTLTSEIVTGLAKHFAVRDAFITQWFPPYSKVYRVSLGIPLKPKVASFEAINVGSANVLNSLVMFDYADVTEEAKEVEL